MDILFFIGAALLGILFGYQLPRRKKDLLHLIIKKLNHIMAKSQERFDLLMGRLDTITTDIAADYALLLKTIQDGADGISEESFAKHEANITKLEELGASVENPVPPVEPPVDPPVDPEV